MLVLFLGKRVKILPFYLHQGLRMPDRIPYTVLLLPIQYDMYDVSTINRFSKTLFLHLLLMNIILNLTKNDYKH